MAKVGRPRLYTTNAECQAACRARKRAKALQQIPVVQGPGYTLYQADCVAVLRLLPPVDAVITDPPYGLDLGMANNPRKDRTHLGKQGYGGYDDTYANFCALIVPRLNLALDLAPVAAVFTGPHTKEQRKPTVTGGVWLPGATGRTPWGSHDLLQVLYYGTPPNPGQHRPLVFRSSGRDAHADVSLKHATVKPLPWMRRLVEYATRPGDLVLDPFMGSATTGVACLELGRRFLGIEMDPTHFQEACQRMASAAAQGQLFAPTPKPKQTALFA
jgi:site-specific DNA-methyltransferase (adenine-specific)